MIESSRAGLQAGRTRPGGSAGAHARNASWDVGLPDTFRAAQHGMHVFQFKFSSQSDSLPADTRYLDESEFGRSGKFVRRRDANRFIVGRSMLRQVLGTLLEMDPRDVPLRVDRGRPFLDPDCNTDWHFNLSHSGEYVVLAVSHGHTIGIDVELCREFPDRDAVARRVMTEAEFSRYMAIDEHERSGAFYRLWVRKESAMKCLGKGFGIDPRELYVGHSVDAPSTAQLGTTRLRLRHDVIREQPATHHWAIACPGKVAEVEPFLHVVSCKFN